MTQSSVSDFFHHIVPLVRDVVERGGNQPKIATNKQIGDYATETDIAVEGRIVQELAQAFPGDAVMAEEGYATASIPEGRIWIIDPICGTNNLGRGLSSFCTNIALADGGKLIASRVIDHTKGDYFWSIGNNAVFINNSPLDPEALNDLSDVYIDIDLGALPSTDSATRDRQYKAARALTDIPGYVPLSLNTSLGFAYTAIGKVDGFINAYNHPWDIAAASFLIQQSDGVITDLLGSPWSLASVGAIGARNHVVHEKLLEIYTTQ